MRRARSRELPRRIAPSVTPSELLSSSTSPAPEHRENAQRSGVAGAADTLVGPGERVLLRALLGLRWAGLALAVVVAIYQHEQMQRPATATLALAAMATATGGLTAAFARSPSLLVNPTVVAIELVIAFAVRAADGWAFGPAHSFTTTLGLVWAFGAVMTAGIAWGRWAGLLVGLAVGLGGWVGNAAPDLRSSIALALARESTPRFLPIITSLTLFALAGFGAGFITHLLRRTQDQVAELRARHQVASVLHDGTLQALAYISRRAADPDIARVARDADIELRGYLSATLTPATGEELRSALLTAARRVEHQMDAQLRLAIDPELPDRDPAVVAALTGAITEALTNTAKHANAGHVTLYAAVTDADGIQLSVIDDGDGFDPDAIPPGGGLDQSIRARLRAVGGTVTIRSTPGSGTEVELWAP